MVAKCGARTTIFEMRVVDYNDLEPIGSSFIKHERLKGKVVLNSIWTQDVKTDEMTGARLSIIQSVANLWPAKGATHHPDKDITLREIVFPAISRVYKNFNQFTTLRLATSYDTCNKQRQTTTTFHPLRIIVWQQRKPSNLPDNSISRSFIGRISLLKFKLSRVCVCVCACLLFLSL